MKAEGEFGVDRFLKVIRAIKADFARTGYICKDREGKTFFGEITIILNDGKIIHSKNESDGEFLVKENIKL